MLRILAPTDFSPGGFNATLVAMRLAQRLACEVIFVHAMAKPPVPAASPEDLFLMLYQEEERSNRQKLHEECQHLLDILNIRHAEIQYKIMVVPTPFAEAMLQIIYQEKIDLVVIGSRGSSNLKKIFMGSNTKELMQLTPVPLLIIPSDVIFEGFSSITLLLQQKNQTFRPGITILERLARTYEATLHFLVMTKDGQVIKDISEISFDADDWHYLLKFPHTVNSMAEADELAGIENHMEQTQTNLIVLFPDRRSVWVEFFSNDIADDLAGQAKVPLLVLPNQA